jgi:RHS repeat-associated protein
LIPTANKSKYAKPLMIYPAFSKYLQKSTIIYLLCLFFINSNGQVRPGSATNTASKTGSVAAWQPANYPSTPIVNCIAVFTPQQAGFTTDSSIRSLSNSVDKVNISTQYLDGLGRPIQTVDYEASPSKKDVMSPVVYNQFGQEEYKFLPYTGGSDGSFKTNAFSAQKAFYNTTIPPSEPAYSNEQFYYSHIDYESSPLNRISKTFAAGNAWAGSEGGPSEKAISVQYLLNTANDHVRIWAIGFDTTLNDATNIPTSATGQEYAVGTLYKTVTVDEHGSASVEYKDLEGHIILKKVQVGSVASDYSGYNGFLCTYYVYDDLGQLRFVIPPKAVANITNSWVISTAIAGELCFRYEYDERERIKAKKVPGADWVYMVYDNRDRIVYTQDGDLRSKSPGQWTYTLYDALNRPVQTGIMSYSGKWSDVAAAAASTTNGNFSTNDNGTFVNTTPIDLMVSSRDNAVNEYDASSSITFENGFTTETKANFVAQITAGSASSFSTIPNIALNPFPLDGYTLYPETYTYYDNYSFGTSKKYTGSFNSQLNDGGGNPTATLEAVPSSSTTQTAGLVTGTRVKVLEDPTDLTKGAWMETVSFYDSKARPVQVQSDNYKSGVDITVNRYNFINHIVSNLVVHNNPQAGKTGSNNVTVYTSTQYDHIGRVVTVNKKVTYKKVSYTRIIARNTYDELGQLKNKKTGQKSSTDTTALENDDYNYNIRGWLKGTNWYKGTSYASQVSPTSNKWFAFDLSYDWGMGTNQYNGNIAGIRWKSAGDPKERAFGYTYDKSNRLLAADFSQYNSSWGTDPILNFDIKMGDGNTTFSAYDENGNIKMMQQWGVAGLNSKQIDKLTYTYVKADNSITSTNKLFNVAEDASIGATDNHVGDFTDKNTSGDDYAYDNNGNLTLDKNKNIQTISYNQLNLPYQLTINNDDGTAKGIITYIYDALGNKLEKRVSELASSSNNNTASQTQTTYIGPFEYSNNVLQFISNEEGRTRLKQTLSSSGAAQTSFAFDYFLKDHLGNVRMVLTDEAVQDVYPVADMESQNQPALNVEKQYYDIKDGNIVSENAIPNFNGTTIHEYQDNNGNPPYNTNPQINANANSTKLYKLNGKNGVQTGLGITLRVMAGDVINIFGKSFYHLNNNQIPNNIYPLSNALLSFLNVFAGSAVVSATHGGITGATLNGNSGITGTLNSWLNGPSHSPTGTTPKAYINWVFLDDRFQPNTSVNGMSGASVVSAYSDTLLSHSIPAVNISQNGYIYVYCSNESDVDVFFDNLQVIDTHGPLVEETHYYPFGLTMAGISSQALSFGDPQNNKLYNKGSELQHHEFSDGSGLELYSTEFRSLDPQLGRWWQMDPKPDMALSPYSAMNNNPILINDPLGDTGRLPKTVVVPIPQKKWPNVYKTLLEHIGKGKSPLVTYDSDKKAAEQRSREAKKGHPPAKPGYNLHEFPPKMAKEGGTNAVVNEIPESENKSEGGVVGGIIRANNLQTGDKLLYEPIPDTDDPDNSVPAANVDQQQKPNDDSGTQNAPGMIMSLSSQKAQTVANEATAAIVGYAILKVAEAALTWECGGCAAWLLP